MVTPSKQAGFEFLELWSTDIFLLPSSKQRYYFIELTIM